MCVVLLLLLLQVTGNCACPAGTWVSFDATGKPRCSDCAKGSYCPGSDFFLASNSANPLRLTAPGLPAPQPVPCPLGTNARNMTTLGRRATSSRACGEHTPTHILPCKGNVFREHKGLIPGLCWAAGLQQSHNTPRAAVNFHNQPAAPLTLRARTHVPSRLAGWLASWLCLWAAPHAVCCLLLCALQSTCPVPST